MRGVDANIPGTNEFPYRSLQVKWHGPRSCLKTALRSPIPPCNRRFHCSYRLRRRPRGSINLPASRDHGLHIAHKGACAVCSHTGTTAWRTAIVCYSHTENRETKLSRSGAKEKRLLGWGHASGAPVKSDALMSRPPRCRRSASAAAILRAVPLPAFVLLWVASFWNRRTSSPLAARDRARRLHRASLSLPLAFLRDPYRWRRSE